MAQKIRYIGTQDGWFEVAVTGRQSNWQTGQMEERSDEEAALLLATGLFETLPSPLLVTFGPAAGQIALAAGTTALAGVFVDFAKADSASSVFVRTGLGTVSLKAGTTVRVADVVWRFAADTPVIMPGTLVAGTDYAIYVCVDGSVRADANWSAPAGYTTATARKIGGCYYAPGGLATGTSGGNTTPQILEGTFWDLKFRPAAPDPRGMKLVNNEFWVDLWLLNTEHITNGTSKFGATIADGASPPKIPLLFGGTGANAYTSLNWWEAAEVMKAYGKRLPSYDEFAAAAYGTTEATSRGSDPVTCQVDAPRTSQHMFQATGNLWIWGAEFGGGTAAAGYVANTGGRGSTYQLENAVLFAGNWDSASFSGARASIWGYSPTNSGSFLGARGVCDHMQHD